MKKTTSAQKIIVLYVKKTKDEISMKILEKEMKLERLNRLIKRKGFQKRKRYEKLLNRIA